MQGARPDHNNSNYVRILYFNARSLYPKYDELCAFSEVEKPNIICITESWLHMHDGILPSECYIPGIHVLDATEINMGEELHYTSAMI